MRCCCSTTRTRPPSTPGPTAVGTALAPHDVKIVHQLALDLQLDENGIAREHFGFADGLSQPIPFGDRAAARTTRSSSSNGQPALRDPWHGVPLGEILLGHTNAHPEKSPGPMVPDDLLSRTSDLKQDGAPEGFFNFGLNGSYMVVRELRQYVARFWKSLEDNAARIRAHDPAATHVTADWLAERIVGRTIDGHLLCPGGRVLPPDQLRFPAERLPLRRRPIAHGHGCPLGSHVRRANPRDGLAQGSGVGADPARRRQQSPHPAARPQVRPAAHGSPRPTTARSAACCSSASTPTSRASSSSSSRPGC